ncbi:MAG: TetR/AcrR family transcriptional regulator [Thermoleophilaceae bacterium]
MAVAAADTQGRILESAWGLVRTRGAAVVTMRDVAEAAGVSRQLVYIHFGDRAGLLLAMARHHDERSGFRARVADTRSLPPAEGLEALLREWFAYIPEILPVAAALQAAAAGGDPAAAAWGDRMDDLRAAFRVALARLRRGGRLNTAWTVEAAADWVWSRSHLSAWQQLVGERGWSTGRFVERSVRSILSELVVPAP